ncbi:MAG: HEAT repeat domain-containing protein [Nitrospirota bacterium]
MPEERDKIPLDAQILSDAIIELNISRRNVTVYPRGHPSVETSLNHAFDHLQKLFELRPEITLAIAKDTLIIDDYFLDRKNPVYREFALHLSRMNIAFVTFISGLTKDELYEFHRLLSEGARDMPSEDLKEALKGPGLIHIKAGFIDYDAFSFHEGKKEEETREGHLWERYVYGLLEGTLQTGDIPDLVQEIPPEILAGLMNRTVTNDLKEESYDRVITSYMKKSSERTFSSKDLKRLMDFIDGLKPELKKQFLSSAFKNISKDMEAAEKSLKDVEVDKIIELLSTINEQKVAIPDALKNLLDKFSKLNPDGTLSLISGGSIIVDDIFLSPDVMGLLIEGDFEKFVTDKYQKEIRKVSEFDTSEIIVEELKELKKACSDEHVERDFNQIILELISSDVISEEEYSQFITTLKEQAVNFISTGQYGIVLRTLRVMESNIEAKRFPDTTSGVYQYFDSPEFVSQFIDSLRITGRQVREEAFLLCDYYGDGIIPPLMDALIEEDSQMVRRFFIALITKFGGRAVPETIKRLGDSRWFVKRNMLFILRECGGEDVLPLVRTYRYHKNPKVVFEAIKCLLKFGDSSGIVALRKHLTSEDSDVVEQAIALSGSHRVKETVPELIRMLRKKSISGADFHEKIPVVKALGQIGDPGALTALRDILSTKSLFYKGAVDKLKEEIYMTLKNYPYEDVKDLIEEGIKSRNEQIREESLRLRSQYAG